MKIERRLALGIVTSVTTAAFAALGTGAAQAQSSFTKDTTADIATIAAARHGGGISHPGGGPGAEQVKVNVSLPSSKSAPVTLAVGGRRLTVVLPDVQAQRTRNHGRAQPYGRDKTHLALFAKPDGVQVMAVLVDASASNAQRYRFPGAALVAQPDGSVIIRGAGGEAVGGVAAPWAEDANGKQLSTRYMVDGDHLTQVTDTRGAVFPVVADPRVSFGWFIYIRFSKSEVRGIVGDWLRGQLDLDAAFCGFVPSPYNIPCGLVLHRYVSSIRDTWTAAYNHHQCMEYRLTYSPMAVVGWRNYSC